MLKKIVILVLTLAFCHADTPVPSQGVYCGYMPENIYSCMGDPKIISGDITRKCTSATSACDKMKCIFAELDWLKSGKVDKKKVSDYFDTYASTNPAWSAAVNHLKAACLGDRDLPAQGTFINCPAYDVLHCAVISFIKNASPSQWRAGAECAGTRSYAAACPVCPDECFATQVPNDSCHACQSLPRSA